MSNSNLFPSAPTYRRRAPASSFICLECSRHWIGGEPKDSFRCRLPLAIIQAAREWSSDTKMSREQARRFDQLSRWGGCMLRFALLLLACVFSTSAVAEYPDKPIRLVVPQAAGSATDAVARILGAELAKEIGQQIVVDNRPGGALTIGLDLTAKAEPDGYTICMGPIGAL